MDVAFVLPFVLVVLAAVAVIVLGYRAKQRRQQRFSLIARQLGLSYAAQDPFGLLGWPFVLFGRGDGQGVENVVWGEWQGVPIHAFDFWFYDETTDANGRTSKSYTRFDCAVAPIDAACPGLTIERENMLTRLADALALKDIQFESDEFNRAFNVKSGDPAFATAFVDARMMSWLLANGTGYAFEAVGNRLLVAGPRIDPLQLVPVLGTAKAFRDQVPRVVFSLYPKSG